MRKILTLVLLIILAINQLQAQCSCTNCTLNLPPSGPASSTINISGATNPTLGQNGQDLKAVHIYMIHDAIDELDITLIAPDGSSVLLSQYTGLSVGQNITFDICFVACNETAMPDPGFPANFDSQAGYQPNTTYTGIYYPSTGGGCFEGLTGDVNGDWTLDFLDNVGLDGGELFDWSLEFYDNSGTGCTSVCNITSCDADGGDIGGSQNTYCEGDMALNYNLPPTYGGSPPDPANYGYTYVISDNTTDVILDYTMTPDLTTYTEGEYRICGLSYLLTDFSSIPSPNGSYTTVDLENDIMNEVFCADLSTACEIVTIEAPLASPVLTGPTTVCEEELVTYEITNYDPNLTYAAIINSGTYSQFSYSGGSTITVQWTSGPGEICIETGNVCGMVSDCITVTVEPILSPPSISGNDPACPNTIETYTVSPSPPPGGTYSFSITGGNIITQSGNQVDVEWLPNGGLNELCVDINGVNCPPPTECISVELYDYIIPNDLNSPFELCIDENGSSFINPDPEIISYVWSGSGITITSGQGTNSINYSIDQSGLVSVCLEVETICGFQGPVCDDIQIEDLPQPVIDPLAPTCELDFVLSASINSGNTVLWEQIDGPPGASFNPDDQASTNVSVPEAGLYTFTIEEFSNLCSGKDTITVEVLESPEIVDISFDCTLDEYQVSFEIIGGTPPYDVNGSPISGSSFQSNLIPTGNNFNFIVVDANGCTAETSGSYDCPCISDAGTMSLGLLSACAVEGESIFAFHNGDATLDGNDIGLYYLHDGNSNMLGNIFGTSTTGEFFFQPGMVYGQIYYVSFVVGNDINGEPDLSDPCLSVSVGQPVVFYQDPQLAITSDTFSCSLDFPLSATISSDVIAVQWEQLSGPGFSNFTSPNSPNTFVNVDQAGTYTYLLIGMNEACTDTVEFNFLVNGIPEVSNLQDDCNSLDEYTLTFTVSGGTPPYSANINGSFTGNIFTSDPLNTSNTYTIEITDDLGCATSFTMNPIQCDCISEAGMMGADSILLCETDDSISIDYLGQEVLDGDDTTAFVIHSGNSNILIDPVFIAYETAFPIPDTLETGRTYYISHVVGTINNGSIDLSDGCLDVSAGQPLYIYPVPNVMLGPDITSCESSIEIPVPNANAGEVRLISRENTTDYQIELETNTISLSTDSANTFVLEYSVSNPRCSARDTIQIEFFDRPKFSEIEEVCIGQTFTVQFEISGGSPPYILNGDTLSSNIYISDTFPSGTELIYHIRDANGCSSDTLSIQKDCSCLADAGNISPNELVLCEGESIDIASLTLSDTLLESGDTYIFVLHTGTVDSVGSILAESIDQPITFDPSLDLGTYYYLHLLVGDTMGNSINFNDPCLAQSNGIRIQWLEASSLDFTLRDTSCLNDTVYLEVPTSGIYPFEIYLSSNQGRTRTINITDSINMVGFDLAFENEQWELDSTSALCEDMSTGSISLIAVAPQEVSFQPPPQICNNAIFGSTIVLDQLLTDQDIEGNWISPTVTIDNGSVDFDGIAPGSYPLIFSTIGSEEYCPGTTDTIIIEVVECVCPQLNLPDEISFCNAEEAFALGTLINFPVNGEWTIQNINNTAQPPLVNNDDLIIDGRSGGLYGLTFRITDSLPAQCPEEFTLDLILSEELFAGMQEGIPVYCKGEAQTIDLQDILEGEDPGGIWTSADTIITANVQIMDLEPGIYQFEYILTDSAGLCPDDSAKLMIEIADIPDFDLSKQDPSCFGSNDGAVSIQLKEDVYAPYTFYLNGSSIEDTTITGLRAGTYSIRVENNKGCTTERAIELDQADELSVDLGDDVTLNRNQSNTFNFSSSIPDSQIQSIQWFIDGELMSENIFNYSGSFSQNSLLSIVISNENGCRARDSLQIVILSSGIYIPNVFNPNSGIPENQTFGIPENPEVSNIKLFRMYDRWGELLYERRNLDPDDPQAYWDGTFNGEDMPPGVYVYSFEILTTTGQTRVISGDVTLLP